jgi:hypothetical protein
VAGDLTNSQGVPSKQAFSLSRERLKTTLKKIFTLFSLFVTQLLAKEVVAVDLGLQLLSITNY